MLHIEADHLVEGKVEGGSVVVRPHVLVPGVGALQRTEQYDDQLGVRQEGVRPHRHHLPVEVGAALLEKVRRPLLRLRRNSLHELLVTGDAVVGGRSDGRRRNGRTLRGQDEVGVVGQLEEVHVPVDAAQVVLAAAEELHLLEGGRTGPTGHHRGVHRQEGVECRRARLLRADDEKLRPSKAGLARPPDVVVPPVVAGIPPDGLLLLGVRQKVPLGELQRRQRQQLQIGPALHKLHRRLEGVQGEAVIGVIGLMRHEDVHLVEDEGVEEVAAEDAALQLLPPSGVALQEDGVRVQATGLSRQHHNILVDEAPAQVGRPQVWVLLGAGDAHLPHLLPGVVQLLVNGENAGVVRRDGVLPGDGQAPCLGKVSVEQHLRLNHRHVGRQVRLTVREHVTEPAELAGVLC